MTHLSHRVPVERLFARSRRHRAGQLLGGSDCSSGGYVEVCADYTCGVGGGMIDNY
jgi:hypothetical protein